MTVINTFVNPKRPIRTLPEFGLLRVNKTLMLTKDQVLKVLDRATVYRRFNYDKLERVSLYNIDRLHRETYMTEKEYEAMFPSDITFVKPEADEPVITVSTLEVVVEDIPSNSTEIEENVVFATEEVQEDTTSGEITEESTESGESDTETQTDEAVEETVVVESNEEVEDNSEEEKEEVEKTSSKTSVNYNGKKKHHNH